MKRLGGLLLAAAAVVVGALAVWNWPDDTPQLAAPLSVTTAQTDLAILSATVERVADPDECGGHSLCLIVAVANWGPVDITDVTDGCGSPSFGDEEPWAFFAYEAVIPADTYTTFRAPYPSLGHHLPATFTLICEIDAANRIDEPNETNNRYTTEVTL